MKMANDVQRVQCRMKSPTECMIDRCSHFLPAQCTYCYYRLGDCDDVLSFPLNLSSMGFSSESHGRWEELKVSCVLIIWVRNHFIQTQAPAQ